VRAVQDLASVTAAILAGGLGTRLRSVVADRPKVLAEIRGRPFLAYLLDQLAAAGLRTVVLCTGYMGEQVRAMFGDFYGDLRLAYSQESSPLGTAGALRLALPLFKAETVLVMNGDSFCQVNLRAFWAWHCARGADATLLLTRVPDTKRYGRVHVDADGLVLRFDEKDNKPVLERSEGSGPGWINAGIYLLNRRLLLTIPSGSKNALRGLPNPRFWPGSDDPGRAKSDLPIPASGAVSLEREVFPAWISRGLYGYRSEGRFLDIGTPEAYAAAEQFFRSEYANGRIQNIER